VSHIEIIAAITALAGVLLTAFGKTMGWPLGIIGALFYVFIFFGTQLYAEAVLQAFYVIMGFYGWLQWKKTTSKPGNLQVVSQTAKFIYISGLIIVAGALILGYLLDFYSDTNVPYLDATLGISGLVITWQMAKKQLECWIWWIVVDVLSSGVFYYKELYATALLYLVFAGLAGFGYISWKKQLAIQ
jgi:nicotinamide mononucleotide transporter